MKRIFCFVVIAVMILTLASCGNDATVNNDSLLSSTAEPSSDTSSTELQNDSAESSSEAETSDSQSSNTKPTNTSSSKPSSSQSPSSKPNKVTVPDDKLTAGTEQVKLFGNLKGKKLRVAAPVTLEKWESDFYKKFEESTGMTVEIEHMSSSEAINKIVQAIAAGDTSNYFDVAPISSTDVLRLVYSNVLYPMDKYIHYDDPVWNYSPYTDFNSLDIVKINGHYYGAPTYDIHENYIFYNKSLFKEMHAPDPYTEYYLKDNWTFETFLDTCKAVTKKKADGSVEVSAWATWNFFVFPEAAGNDVIAQNNNKWDVTVGEPNGIAGLDVLYQSSLNGYVDSKTSGHYEFFKGKVAMIIERPSRLLEATKIYGPTSYEVGLIPLPKMDKNQKDYVCPTTFSAHGIARCAQNQAGAAAFVYYRRLNERIYSTSEEYKKYSLKLLLSQESVERRKEYISKCEFSYSMVDSLKGWFNENRTLFLNVIFKNKTKPASAINSMIPLVRDSLNKTIN